MSRGSVELWFSSARPLGISTAPGLPFTPTTASPKPQAGRHDELQISHFPFLFHSSPLIVVDRYSVAFVQLSPFSLEICPLIYIIRRPCSDEFLPRYLYYHHLPPVWSDLGGGHDFSRFKP